VTPTFYLADGTTMAGDAFDATSALSPINLPAGSTLQVGVLLSGDLHDVAQVLVELTYDDGAGYTASTDRRLASLADLQRWMVPLRLPAHTAFRYSAEIDYHHRAPEVRDEVQASGSQTIAVEIPPVPTLRVAAHPELVDFAALPLVTVVLVHDGASPARASLPFTTPAPQTWEAPLVAGEASTFSYAITYHPAGRDAVALAPIASRA